MRVRGGVRTQFSELKNHPDDRFKYYESANTLEHPLSNRSVALSEELDAAVHKICEMGDGITAWREEQETRLSAILRRLEPLNETLKQIRPPHVVEAMATGSGKTNFAFMCAFGDALGWKDHQIVRDLLLGTRAVGTVFDTGLYARKDHERLRKEKEAQVSMATLRESNQESNGSIKATLRRIRARAIETGDTEGLRKLRRAKELSDKEVADNLSHGPYSMSELNKRYGYGPQGKGGKPGPDWRGLMRTAIEQGIKEDGSVKERLIDNASANDVNATARTEERLGLKSGDFHVAIALRIHELLGITQMVSGEDDESDAFRTICTRSPQFRVALVIDEAGEIWGYVPHGMSYGFRLSPLNFSRRASLLCAIAMLIFAVPVANYIDDYSTPEPLFARGPVYHAALGLEGHSAAHSGVRFPWSGQGRLWRSAEICGASFSTKKSIYPQMKCTPCGITTDFSEMLTTGQVLISIKESTRLKIHEMATTAIAEKHLSPSAAGTLAAKGRFGYNLGPLGRAALRSLYSRQYSKCSPELHPIRDAVVLRDLRLMADLYKVNPPSVIFQLTPPSLPPTVIFSDASFSGIVRPPYYGVGRIATIVRLPLSTSEFEYFYISEIVPQSILARIYKLRKQSQFIFTLETLATTMAYFCPQLQKRLMGRDILHFGDNTGNNGAVIKGYSPAPDTDMLVGNLHLRLRRLAARFWLHYVPSKANPADLPTRVDMESQIDWKRFTDTYSPTRLSFVCTSLAHWTG